MEESDLEVLREVRRRLSHESKEKFDKAHQDGMAALRSDLTKYDLDRLERAIKEERQAADMMQEAIELQRETLEDQELGK